MAAVKKITATKSLPAKKGARKVIAKKSPSARLQAAKQQYLKPAVKLIASSILEETGGLPGIGQETKLFLFPLDPYQLFSYWTISPEDFEKRLKNLRRKYKQLAAIIRFYDVTGLIFNGSNALSSFDIEVDLCAGKCYIPLWRAGRQYVADLGVRNEFGVFFQICRSNPTEVPRDPFSREDSDIPSAGQSRPVSSSLSESIDRDFMPGISSHPAN